MLCIKCFLLVNFNKNKFLTRISKINKFFISKNNQTIRTVQYSVFKNKRNISMFSLDIKQIEFFCKTNCYKDFLC